MVKTALRIWIGARMAQEFFALEENNSLGVEVVRDSSSIHNGNCPLPPVLDHQVDVLMIHAMLHMKDQILQEMQTIIVTRKYERWYEVYLTVFVLLATLQYVYTKQERWWNMHNFTVGSDQHVLHSAMRSWRIGRQQLHRVCLPVHIVSVHGDIQDICRKSYLSLQIFAERACTVHTRLG